MSDCTPELDHRTASALRAGLFRWGQALRAAALSGEAAQECAPMVRRCDHGPGRQCVVLAERAAYDVVREHAAIQRLRLLLGRGCPMSLLELARISQAADQATRSLAGWAQF
jgi:hypothetical protein